MGRVTWQARRKRQLSGYREHPRRAAVTSCLPLKDTVVLRASRKLDLARGIMNSVNLSRSAKKGIDAQDIAYLGGVGDDCDESHLGSTAGTDHRVDLVDLRDQLCAF
jgi:hypothetical protein